MVKPVFKATKSKQTQEQTQASYSVELKADEYVFKEGDLGTEMYIIQDGQVVVLKELKGVERQLALLSRGDFFGEMSVLEDLPRTASVKVVTDCRLLQIGGATFDQMLRRNPEIAVRMMRKLSRRLRETDQLLRQALGSDETQAPEMPTPEQPRQPQRGPERLVHDQTTNVFYLSENEETTVGRRDPVTGINPDIDLTPADTQRSISRRHARIMRKDGKFFLREEIGTMNGTFINGDRLDTSVPREFKHGDEVRFGLIKTIFHAH